MNISKELLNKYNTPIPRYTSYPPANFFEDGFEHEQYEKAIIVSNNEIPENISIYIHIPFCRKMCHYCGCNTSVMQSSDVIRAYVKSIINEMKLCFKYLDKGRKISQIHYGGGTPNAIEVDYLEEINNYIFSSFNLIDDAEVAIECNPADLTERYVERMKEAGFNRFSLGIQDFNRDVLNIINRKPSYIPVEELIRFLKYDNKRISVNLDFIYGLPLQTVDSFKETIQKGIDTGADRIVTFSYAHVPWVNKAQMILEKVGLPSENDKINMFESAYNLLCENGYNAIGLDHYALKTDELSKALDNSQLHRNFQGYCTTRTTGQVYAFGVSAISQFESSFIQNTKDINEYIYHLNRNKFACKKGYILSENDKIIKAIIDEIMCNKRLNISSLHSKLNISKDIINPHIEAAKDSLKHLANDGIITFSDGGFEVNNDNILFIRNVAAAFDPLLKNKIGSFSKPV